MSGAVVIGAVIGGVISVLWLLYAHWIVYRTDYSPLGFVAAFAPLVAFVGIAFLAVNR